MNEVSAPYNIKSKPWVFFVFAFILSWLFWVPTAILSHTRSTFPLGIFSFLGGFGPSLAGIIMVYRTRNESSIADFWKRTVSFKRISGWWYVIIFLIFPFLTVLSAYSEILIGKDLPFFPLVAAIVKEPWLVIFLPVIAIQVALLGPFSEELGWRGYALDALQQKRSAFSSSLIIGILWSAWHIPLFFVREPGNFYYEWGFGTELFWLFFLRMSLLSVLMTWIYNNNQRSILSAILVHLVYNFTFSFAYPIPGTMHVSGTILILIFTVAIIIIWGPKSLTRSGSESSDYLS